MDWSGFTPKQRSSTEQRWAEDAARVEALLRPFLADGVAVSAPRIPAGEGITLTLPDGRSVTIDAIGDDHTYLEVST